MFKFIAEFFINWLTYEHEIKTFPKCDFDRIRYELRPCDVLLFEGRSRVSEVIKTITQSPWSHSALYLGRLHDIEDEGSRRIAEKFFSGKPDTQLVLEGIMGKGTVITPLKAYKKDHIRICRPRGLSPADAQKVISYAIAQLGTDYDVRQILDLARFLLPWSIFPRRWRSKLFKQHAGQSVRTVCSTVIAEAFSSVDFPILPSFRHHEQHGIQLVHRNPRLFTPKDFDYSPYFEIIKYPFLEIDNQPPYRRLPWNKDAYSHDEHLHGKSHEVFIYDDNTIHHVSSWRAKITEHPKDTDPNSDPNKPTPNKSTSAKPSKTDPKPNSTAPKLDQKNDPPKNNPGSTSNNNLGTNKPDASKHHFNKQNNSTPDNQLNVYSKTAITSAEKFNNKFQQQMAHNRHVLAVIAVKFWKALPFTAKS